MLWITFDFVGARPPGRIASSTSACGASRTSSHDREPLAQPPVGDVAVAVVRVLRQDGEDQLVDRRPVRLELRLAVRRAQALQDRADAAAVRPLPVALVTFHPWTSSSTAPRSPGSRPSGARPATRRSSTSTATRTTPTCWLPVPRADRRRRDGPARASAGRRSPPTSTTRSRATATGSTRSGASSAGIATGCSCTTGARSAWRWRSASPSASTGS